MESNSATYIEGFAINIFWVGLLFGVVGILEDVGKCIGKCWMKKVNMLECAKNKTDMTQNEKQVNE